MLEIDPANVLNAIYFTLAILVLGIIALFTNNKPESTSKHKHHKKRRNRH